MNAEPADAKKNCFDFLLKYFRPEETRRKKLKSKGYLLGSEDEEFVEKIIAIIHKNRKTIAKVTFNTGREETVILKAPYSILKLIELRRCDYSELLKPDSFRTEVKEVEIFKGKKFRKEQKVIRQERHDIDALKGRMSRLY